MTIELKPYLRSIDLEIDSAQKADGYPFGIPAIAATDSVAFHPDVTFLIGESGAGKSTLIEAIAVALGFNAEGGTKQSQFSTRNTHSNLHECLKLVQGYKRPEDGFFLRAESFYNLATLMDETNYLKSYGGVSLHEQSHGESFLNTLTYKLRGNGLYILDEPEAALSPTGQMAVLSLLHDLVLNDSQFIIATHSPILLAYPRAKILQLTEHGIEEVSYQETENYSVMKNFLNNHENIVRHLIG